ncbi:MAG: hypothetical protein K8S25_10440 [Alphaproteobacteria bacterium]|nr:hypothetical protein [Alphaproteobacteria bacterium]
MNRAKKAVRWLTLFACAAIASFQAAAQNLPFISEETPPAFCATGFALAKLKCAGRYCDNVKGTCWRYADPPSVPSSQASYWTNWFSEERSGEMIEGANFPKLADNYSVAVGIQCRGRYCDDMRLLMLPLRGPRVATLDSKSDYPICRISPSFSEEAGNAAPQPAAPSPAFIEFIHRVGCSGRYCDNLRIEWCRVFPAK